MDESFAGETQSAQYRQRGKVHEGQGPGEMCDVETFASKEEAMSREFAVKHLARAEKEKLILGALRDSHIKS